MNTSNRLPPHAIIAVVIFTFFTLFMMIGCSTTTIQSSSKVAAKGRWILLPVQNFSETPQASKKVEAILTTLLRARGIKNLDFYPPSVEENSLLELNERRRFEKLIKWAQEKKYIYAVTGSVEEWRYKSGIEGTPAVGISLQVIDVATRSVLWSASGARAGWGRETISGAAQKLIKKMIMAIHII